MKKVFLFLVAIFCSTAMFAKQVSVTVQPDNAQLIQKGKVVQPVSPGVYNIKVSLGDLVFTAQADGYDAEQFIINLKSPATMQINLKPNKKHVNVTSDPSTATIFVDGREAGNGQAQFEIRKGESKTIKLVADEYDTYLKRINFNDQVGIDMTYNVSMVRNTRTINVLVDAPAAEFYADGILVTKGKNSAEFQIHKNRPTQLIVRAEGYLEFSKMIYFTEDRNSINLTSELSIDQSYAASQSSAGTANRRQEFMVKKSMSREQATQRMKYYISELFETLEINDNVSGWYRTEWNYEEFPGDICIRTRLEIKEIPDNGDGQLKFKYLLQSQYTTKKSRNDEDYKDWDRVLKKYAKLVVDIRNLVE